MQSAISVDERRCKVAAPPPAPAASSLPLPAAAPGSGRRGESGAFIDPVSAPPPPLLLTLLVPRGRPRPESGAHENPRLGGEREEVGVETNLGRPEEEAVVEKFSPTPWGVAPGDRNLVKAE